MFKRILAIFGVTKHDTSTQIQTLVDQDESPTIDIEQQYLKDCPPDSMIFLFGTESNREYNRKLVKFIVKQDKSKMENSTNDSSLHSSDSVVQYAPLPCSSHSIVLLPKTVHEKSQLITPSKKIIIWGGKKNARDIKSNMSTILRVKEDSLLTYYDCESNMWLYAENYGHTYTKDHTHRPNPSLFYHTTTFNPNNRKIYIFGGTLNDSTSVDNLVSNKLYCVSVDDWKWKFVPLGNLQYQSLPPSVNTPSPLNVVREIEGVRGHSCIYRSRSNSLVVYAGNFGGSKLSQYMFEFNCDTETWYHVPQINPVDPRAYHNAVYCKNRDCMIVFGGEIFDPKSSRLEIIKEMCLFYFEEKKWYTILFRGDVSAPICTFGHSTTIIYDRFIISYGGCNREFHPKNQCLVFDLLERRWIKLNVKLQAIEVSAKHTLESSYNQQSWDLSYSTILPPLNCSAMTFDEESQCLIFYGGYVTEKDKCASLFRVKLDIALLLVEKHFVFWKDTISTLSNPNRFNDVQIKISI